MASETKPPDVDSYIDWLADTHGTILNDQYREHFDNVTSKAQRQIQDSAVWQALIDELPRIDATYQIHHGSVLIDSGSQKPSLVVKPYQSFVEKTFRLNVVRNQQWPEPPEGGWYLPPDWLTRTKDLVRTVIHVRYLDGVQVVVEEIEAVCEDQLAVVSSDLEARSEGYYAAHVVIDCECDIPTLKWDTEVRVIRLEVQVATVVQGILRDLLHQHYERRRVTLKQDEIPWQWDFDSDEFATNYLGHISHYVDGMIVGLRDRTKEE